LPLSLLLPTTRNGRGSPKNELHPRHAVAKHHSLNQRVHFLQLGLLGRHFPTKVPHFGPQGVDFIGLTTPQHHRLPPSLTLRSAPCHNNAASPGLEVWVEIARFLPTADAEARRCSSPKSSWGSLVAPQLDPLVSMDSRCSGRKRASPEYKTLIQKPLNGEQIS
jgi:hypothetical protein